MRHLEPWEEQEQRALREWLLNRLESATYWPTEELKSVAKLADAARDDKDFMQVAELYRGRGDFDLATLVAELVESESIPFLPVLRYKPTGLGKRAVWDKRGSCSGAKTPSTPARSCLRPTRID